MNLLNWIIPAVGIGYLLLSAKKKQVEKRLESISVDFQKFKLGFPPKITLRIFNPNSIPISTKFINIQIFFKDIKLASIMDNSRKTLNYGNNDITFDVKASAELLKILTAPKDYAKKDKALIIKWNVGTDLYDIPGEYKYEW